MASTILSYFGVKSRQLVQKWQYLLLQEKCRVCGRFIHPLVKNMDFRQYVPPAIHFSGENEIVSDAVCHFCFSQLSDEQPCVKLHEYTEPDGQITKFFVSSRAVFEEPLNTLIYKFKYDGDVLLAKDLACFMLSAWALVQNEIDPPIIDAPIRNGASACTTFSRIDVCRMTGKYATPALLNVVRALAPCSRRGEDLYLPVSADTTNNQETLCLVPVPLHKSRLKERGFNQSELLTWQLSRLLKIKAETKLLARVRNTTSQQELNKHERVNNVAGAFEAINNQAFAGRHVILIDDVCTSGSTLTECAKAVMAAGALSVCGFTIAYVP